MTQSWGIGGIPGRVFRCHTGGGREGNSRLKDDDKGFVQMSLHFVEALATYNMMVAGQIPAEEAMVICQKQLFSSGCCEAHSSQLRLGTS